MARKKIVFVIVEGPSDQDALELLLDKLFDKSKVYVHVIHGDITTKSGNIKVNVTNEIKRFAQNNHFDKVHFQKVIHIVDADGAYIDDDLIIEDDTWCIPICKEIS